MDEFTFLMLCLLALLPVSLGAVRCCRFFVN